MTKQQLDDATLVEVRKSKSSGDRHREFREIHGYSRKIASRFGGLRDAVLERDARRCVHCGMTDAQHMEKWGPKKPITVDHIDRNEKNNVMSNLQTLCMSCHAKKDTPSLRYESKIVKKKTLILKLRRGGLTYAALGKRLGFAETAILKWCHRWGVPRKYLSKHNPNTHKEAR